MNIHNPALKQSQHQAKSITAKVVVTAINSDRVNIMCEPPQVAGSRVPIIHTPSRVCPSAPGGLLGLIVLRWVVALAMSGLWWERGKFSTAK